MLQACGDGCNEVHTHMLDAQHCTRGQKPCRQLGKQRRYPTISVQVTKALHDSEQGCQKGHTDTHNYWLAASLRAPEPTWSKPPPPPRRPSPVCLPCPPPPAPPRTHLLEPWLQLSSCLLGCKQPQEVLHKHQTPLRNINGPVQPQQHARLHNHTTGAAQHTKTVSVRNLVPPSCSMYAQPSPYCMPRVLLLVTGAADACKCCCKTTPLLLHASVATRHPPPRKCVAYLCRKEVLSELELLHVAFLQHEAPHLAPAAAQQGGYVLRVTTTHTCVW